jgi:hypothetical protein
VRRLLRVFILHNKSRITTEPGHYVRTFGKDQALIAWGNDHERGISGAMVRNRSRLYTPALDVDKVCSIPSPHEFKDFIDRGNFHAFKETTFKSHEYCGGSFSHKLHMGSTAAWEINSKNLSDHPDIEDLLINDTNLICMCLLCGVAHGTFIHVILSCKGPCMEAIRFVLLKGAEDFLLKAASHRVWYRAAMFLPAQGGCLHPLHQEGWQTDLEPFGGEFPIVSLISWLVPTRNEHLFESRNTGGRAIHLETEHDLAYRGGIATSISNFMISGVFTLDRTDPNRITENLSDKELNVLRLSNFLNTGSALLRRTFSVEISKLLKDFSDRMVPPPTSIDISDGNDEAEAPPTAVPGLGEFGDAGLPCSGTPCAKRFSTGTPKKILPQPSRQTQIPLPNLLT